MNEKTIERRQARKTAESLFPGTTYLVRLRKRMEALGLAMRWGLIPSWAKEAKKPQINARGETVAEMPLISA